VEILLGRITGGGERGVPGSSDGWQLVILKGRRKKAKTRFIHIKRTGHMGNRLAEEKLNSTCRVNEAMAPEGE